MRKRKNLVVIAKATELSETMVRVIAGLPFIGPCTIKSIRELRSAFYDLPDGQEKEVCSRQWRDLSLKFLRKTRRIDKIKEAYMVCHPDEKAKAAYLLKWRKVFETSLQGGAKNLKQAMLAYDNFPSAYEKADKVRAWQRAVELAATSEEAAQLWHLTFDSTLENQLAKDRWIVLANKEVDQAKNSTELIALIGKLGAPSFLESVLSKAKHKFNDLIYKEVSAAETFEEIERLCKITQASHLVGALFKKAKKQLQVFLQTDHGLDDLANAFKFSSIFGSRATELTGISLEEERQTLANRMLALSEMLSYLYDLRHVLRYNKTFQEKWLATAKAELNSAKMPKDLLEIIKKSPDNKELKMEIIKKIIGH